MTTVALLCSSTKQSLKQLNLEGDLTSGANKMSTEFNKYFCKIGEKLASKIKDSGNYRDYMPDNCNSMFVSPVPENELVNMIMSLDSNKAVADSDIPTKLLKRCKVIIKIPFLHMVNKSFVTGKFPKILKTARVTPLFKKNDPTEIGNYRPVSILSCISKIIEKLMKKRITYFLDDHNILYTGKYQYGFRKGTTKMALIEITEQ